MTEYYRSRVVRKMDGKRKLVVESSSHTLSPKSVWSLWAAVDTLKRVVASCSTTRKDLNQNQHFVED
jgi:hypothetical protein